MVRNKSSCFFFQEVLLRPFSSWCRRISCLGLNSASSVPWSLCLAESKGLRFLEWFLAHISVCLSNESGLKVRPQTAHGSKIGRSSASIYTVQQLVDSKRSVHDLNSWCHEITVIVILLKMDRGLELRSSAAILLGAFLNYYFVIKNM